MITPPNLGDVVKRRTAAVGWLFSRSYAARVVFVLAVWPIVHIADTVRRVDPPVSLRRGLDWARDPGRYEPTIRTATEPARVRRRACPGEDLCSGNVCFDDDFTHDCRCRCHRPVIPEDCV